MACFPCYNDHVLMITLILLVPRINSSSDNSSLNVNFYAQTCPNLLDIVRKVLYKKMQQDRMVGAALLRLHFHDCFVNGCDGSILLDDTPTLKGEKNARPNMKCLGGFEVIDAIKTSVESACPDTVSCADILAIAAMISVEHPGGYAWQVRLGRRDSLNASQADANKYMPVFSNDLPILISKFKDVGLDDKDLVALSGAHTIGQAKCKNFRARLYNEASMDPILAQNLKNSCSKTGGEGDNNLAPLDVFTPEVFDNKYFIALTKQEGLLHSDQQLYQDNGNTCIRSLVRTYSEEPDTFLSDFVDSMIKMGGISPLTGTAGQIRKNCRKTN